MTVPIRLERWVDPAARGWWSGDHHIHAAGCAHYTNPSEGVHAPDMLRQILGEDLKAGCNLTWGPCFDYQKRFFTGRDDAVSVHPYLLRYDVQVSGFGSHRSGHLCLLRLREQMYPGGDSKDHWPTLGLSTLKWAKKQGAVCGPAHSGTGLDVKTQELPNLEIPRYDGIGANEFIVDVTHVVEGPDGRPVPAIDFISTVDTNWFSELNIWYHTLNVGYRVRASGETDFPCITGERVGLGRSYVKLAGRLGCDEWCEGIRQGRSYVPELVNGRPVATRDVVADGSLHDVVFAGVRIERSSWVAMRVARSSHTNPVFVIVGGRPIRASRASAQWCLDGVEQCWKSKESTYRADELADARAAYEHARGEYRRLVAECAAD